MAESTPTPTPGVKMNYLIKARPTTSREELVAHWFANHMPIVIAAQCGFCTSGMILAAKALGLPDLDASLTGPTAVIVGAALWLRGHDLGRRPMHADEAIRGLCRGLLTRDPRMVERKKYGRAKARRSFQFSKR